MTPLWVLDVSRWQGCIDWDAVQRSGAIDGVMLRVLGSRNGQPYPDPQFERNHAACTARGIPVGGYYYTCAVTSRQTEAELNALRAALRGKTFQLPLAIDVEDARLRSLSPAVLAQRVVQAAAQLEAWNLYAMVYTYTNFADTALAMDALTAYDLWLADYRGKRPTRPHGMWQYTSTGHVAGIDGPVDLSRAYNSAAAQGLAASPAEPRTSPGTKGVFMKHKISPSTIARTAALALALTNQILSATGHAVLPIESAQLEQLVSTGLTVAAALVSWWKNNSFTPEAIEADDYFYKLKSGQ